MAHPRQFWFAMSALWTAKLNFGNTKIISGHFLPHVQHFLNGHHYDACIVGAGLSGAVLAQQHATKLQSKVLVIEKRHHIGGNCYDYIDKDTGIRVNQYGVHLFHTKFKQVWDYIQQFSEWVPWEHKVLAFVDGKHVPVPVNIDTINALFGTSIASEVEAAAWLQHEQMSFPAPGNSEEMALSRVGLRLYNMLFKPYTIKQWDKQPSELGPSVLARIPVRNNHDPRYFTDPYQALPKNGYTAIFKSMFSDSRITVLTNVDYFDVKSNMQCKTLYYTGPIDSYFAHMGLPKLEYRSLEFERKVVRNVDRFQPSSQVNYPSSRFNFTRIIEYKHLLNQTSSHTVIFYEHSTDHGEPYYPVPNPSNQALYAKYQAMADKEPGIHFVGRLANYKYFNMDQTIKNALEVFKQTTTPTAQTIYDDYKAHIDTKMRALPSFGVPCSTHPTYNGEFGYEVVGIVPWYYNEHITRKCDLAVEGVVGSRYLYWFASSFKPRKRRRTFKSLPIDGPLGATLHVHSLPSTRWTMPPWRDFFGGGLDTHTLLGADKPILVIFNKHTIEWGAPPINFIDVKTLRRLLTLLQPQYKIVYVRMQSTELQDDQRDTEFQDKQMIRNLFPDVTLFEDVLDHATMDYNLLLFGIAANARLFVSVQGGTSIVASLWGVPNCIYAVKGAELKVGAYSKAIYGQFSGSKIWTTNSTVGLMQHMQQYARD